MSEFVLDSSAVLAVLCEEPYADELIPACKGACISAVNAAEIYSKASDVGLTIDDIMWALKQLQIVTIDTDDDQARLIGSFREPTREFGLSLGDRACLSLALTRQLPVITCDRQFVKPTLDVEVRLFR